MPVLYDNVIYTKARSRLCKGLVLRMVTNPLVIQFAKTAGFDVVWIEMEHSNYSLQEASVLANAAVLSGMTPIVRVPYECGMGYVQQVLDSGALAVVFPHISSAKEAQHAVQMCKFPPIGKRSLWLQQAAVGLRTLPPQQLADEVNATGSAACMMIETGEAIQNIEEIAAVEGVEMLMVGCIDLSADMRIPGQIHNPKFRAALEAVSIACLRHGKVFGLAGSYSDMEFQDWIINTLGVRIVLGNVDSNMLSIAAIETTARMGAVDRTGLPN
ncbi:Pyruvate/Phosphoenolpyruvate kinase-like domain-containing protein [Xylaria arbuscula]|nr:Pyruvate/Phosphoenolpyruvate kinase-like domain-containing protein [Xylaria arbuscula]